MNRTLGHYDAIKASYRNPFQARMGVVPHPASSLSGTLVRTRQPPPEDAPTGRCYIAHAVSLQRLAASSGPLLLRTAHVLRGRQPGNPAAPWADWLQRHGEARPESGGAIHVAAAAYMAQ